MHATLYIKRTANDFWCYDTSQHTWSFGLAELITACAAVMAWCRRVADPNVSVMDCDSSIMITRSFGVVTAKLYHGLPVKHLQRRQTPIMLIFQSTLHWKIQDRNMYRNAIKLHGILSWNMFYFTYTFSKKNFSFYYWLGLFLYCICYR